MRKGIISLILLIFSMGVMAQSDNRGIKEQARGTQQMDALGDVNGDGDITVTDVMALVDYLLGTSTEEIIVDNADTNQDGSVSVSDVMRLVDMILGISETENKTIINVIVNTGDDSITYGGGGSTPAHAKQSNIWEE